MRIATFNLWNKPTQWWERIDAICEAIRLVDADVIALQEVSAHLEGEAGVDVAQYVAMKTGYPFCLFHPYPDSPDEGLAFLSRMPFDAAQAIWETDVAESDYCASSVTCSVEGQAVRLTNVHLNWRDSSIREAQMEAVISWLSALSPVSVEWLCGDFNDDVDSVLYETLLRHGWTDVVTPDAVMPTLDFETNPHLQNQTADRASVRYDWMLRKGIGEAVYEVARFGDVALGAHDVFPSDHYGVYVEWKDKGNA